MFDAVRKALCHHAAYGIAPVDGLPSGPVGFGCKPACRIVAIAPALSGSIGDLPEPGCSVIFHGGDMAGGIDDGA